MPDDLTRRDWVKLVGAAGAGSLIAPLDAAAPAARHDPAILPLTSTSEVFVPGRGHGFQRFSFDFPEPSVEFGGYRFGFLVFTRENVYGLDAGLMTAAPGDDALTLTATGLVWAGGQEKAPGRLVANFRQVQDAIEWDATVELDQPLKSVTTVIRGVPRGKISSGGGRSFDPHDDELLYGYPFGAGDLFGGNTAWGMGTPYVAIEVGDGDVRYLASLDDRVRAKRFFFQPGETGYRVEAVFEAEGWLDRKRLAVPAWRLGRAATLEAATAKHYAHLEQAYRIPLGGVLVKDGRDVAVVRRIGLGRAGLRSLPPRPALHRLSMAAVPKVADQLGPHNGPQPPGWRLAALPEPVHHLEEHARGDLLGQLRVARAGQDKAAHARRVAAEQGLDFFTAIRGQVRPRNRP